ncbi:MAG: sugar ABC transporter permease [Propionibacteriaceae bacterium]|nr:sugar ABC transporter permease [Propionibacteriaceae bacterium]
MALSTSRRRTPPASRPAAPRARGGFLGSGLAARERRLGLAFSLPAIVVFLVVLAYPIFENFRSAFFDLDFGTGAATWVGLDNFAEILADSNLRRSLGNTLLWTVGSLVGQLGLGLAAALLIDRPLPGMRWVRQFLLMPYVVPVIASALVWQWMLDGNYGIVTAQLHQWGWLPLGASPLGLEASSLLTVVVINIWRGFPFAMLVYWATLQGIDQVQYEAAMVDGAGAVRRFFHITLPNLAGATVSLVAVRGLFTLMYFELIWLTTRGGPAGSSDVLSTYLYRVIMGEFRLGYAAAIAVTVGVVLVLILAIIQVGRRLGGRR